MPSLSIQDLLSALSSKFGSHTEWNSQSVVFLCISMICILAPLDMSQLVFAVMGALAYALLQAITPKPTKTNCQLAADREQPESRRAMRNSQPWSSVKGGSPTQMRPRPRSGPSSATHASPSAPAIKPEVYQPSTNPVTAPKFESIGWEAEVSELVSQLVPGADEDQAVQRLVAHVKRTIQCLFPEVEVTGFVHSSLKCGKAFGVAVPEVDIVANISPAALAQRQHQRAKLDLQKLQKCAVRSACDRLVSNGGLKFRRSAFRGEEPRVTVLVPSALGFFNKAIPVDFSINAVTPFYTSALLTECSQFDPRAKSLILLVKRWAKDRGICHSAKGHLSPYLWTLLVMYFLQVGMEDEGPLLPLLDAFKISSCNPKSSSNCKADASNTQSTETLSVAQLFCKFVEFYEKTFEWRKEAISVRSGRREAPGLALPLHVILCEDGSTHGVGPAIEDPFKSGNNLGTCMNEVSLSRLHQELARAHDLCGRGASLSQLLVPWVPPEENVDRSGGSSDDKVAASAPWRKAGTSA